MTCIIGIDFGTSNSAIAASVDGKKPEIIPFLYKGKSYKNIPTVVAFCDNKAKLYGRAAIQAYHEGETSEKGRFIHSIKRIISNDLQLNNRTQICGKYITYKEIIKDFFSHLKNNAESVLHMPIDHVVIGRPVVFVDDNPEKDQETEEAIREIAKEIGFNFVHFQYEPIAAAFAHEQNIKSEKIALIIDIGGGTSDFSVIKLFPQSKYLNDRKQDILANTGINIAGNDFDYEFAKNTFMPHLGYNKIFDLPIDIFLKLSNWSKGSPQELKNIYNNSQAWSYAKTNDCVKNLEHIINNDSKYELLETIEKTKIYLSDKPEKHFNFDNVITANVSRDDFERSIKNNIEKLKNKINECIQKSGNQIKDIEMLIFTGGSSQIPLLQTHIIEMFPHIKPDDIIKKDVFSSVCLGLTYYGMHLWGNK